MTAANLPLKEQLKALEHLQELDLKIDLLNKRKSALPGGLKTLNDSLAKVAATTAQKKTALGELDKMKRQTQAALDLNQDRLSRANSKLTGVQNSQEFQAANKEIDQLKKSTTTLEEQMNKTNTDMAAVNVEIEKLQAEHDRITGELSTQQGVVTQEAGDLDREISGFVAERSKFTSQIEPRIMTMYDRVRGVKAGIGIAPAIGGRCKACNMMVPPQLFNELQRGNALHSCPSCHRILFIPTASGQQGVTSDQRS